MSRAYAAPRPSVRRAAVPRRDHGRQQQPSDGAWSPPFQARSGSERIPPVSRYQRPSRVLPLSRGACRSDYFQDFARIRPYTSASLFACVPLLFLLPHRGTVRLYSCLQRYSKWVTPSSVRKDTIRDGCGEPPSLRTARRCRRLCLSRGARRTPPGGDLGTAPGNRRSSAADERLARSYFSLYIRVAPR
eukprot:COSAG03_NODE_558_length_6950_cov_4.520362_4_plen_189_part_00